MLNKIEKAYEGVTNMVAPSALNLHIAYLVADGWTEEEIYLTVKLHGHRFTEELKEHMYNCLTNYRGFTRIRLVENELKGEMLDEYNGKNEVKRVNKPNWFGAFINRDLFK